MVAFINSFMGYLIEFIALVVIAIAGTMVGKTIRENKNAKAAQRPRINR